MSNFILNVEVLAGTNIERAIEEAKAKSRMFDLAGIQFKFNGIELFVTSRSDVKELVNTYHERTR